MPTLLQPIPTYASKAEIQDFAEELAGEFWPDRQESLVDVVRRIGGDVKISYEITPRRERESIVVEPNDRFLITIPVYTSARRDSFTISHELGHFFLHWPLVKANFAAGNECRQGMAAARWVDKENQTLMQSEREANWFAAGFLFPKQLFCGMWRKTPDVEYLAMWFEASKPAVEARIRELGI